MNSINQKRVLVVLGGLILALASGASAAEGASAVEKIKVLIIDGQNNHKWQVTTPAIKKMLEDTGRFTVEVATTPPKKAKKDAWEKFRPDFTKHDVVLSNYTGDTWPKDVCDSFEKYMTGGGGLVFYHAAVFAFPQWKAWNEMMGMGWRNNKHGERVSIDDSGKEVRTPKGKGPGGGHGPSHRFEIAVRDKKHPVMKGLPAKWTHAKDELYHGMRGPAKNMNIIATAFSDKKTRGTGTNEAMVWTVPVGKGRVLVTLMGHDVPAVTHPGSAAVLTRGVEWAATGKVTLPVPKELTAVKTITTSKLASKLEIAK